MVFWRAAFPNLETGICFQTFFCYSLALTVLVLAPSSSCYLSVGMKMVKPFLDALSTDKASRHCRGLRHGVQFITLRQDHRAPFLYNYSYLFLKRSHLLKPGKTGFDPWRQRCFP